MSQRPVNNQLSISYEGLSSKEEIFSQLEAQPGVQKTILQAPNPIPEIDGYFHAGNFGANWLTVKEEAFQAPLAEHRTEEIDQKLVCLIKAGEEVFGLVRADLKKPYSMYGQSFSNRQIDLIVCLAKPPTGENKIEGFISEHDFPRLEVGRSVDPTLSATTSGRHFIIDTHGESVISPDGDVYPAYHLADLGSKNKTTVLSGTEGIQYSGEKAHSTVKAGHDEVGVYALKRMIGLRAKGKPHLAPNPLDNSDTWTISVEELERAFNKADKAHQTRISAGGARPEDLRRLRPDASRFAIVLDDLKRDSVEAAEIPLQQPNLDHVSDKINILLRKPDKELTAADHNALRMTVDLGSSIANYLLGSSYSLPETVMFKAKALQFKIGAGSCLYAAKVLNPETETALDQFGKDKTSTQKILELVAGYSSEWSRDDIHQPQVRLCAEAIMPLITEIANASQASLNSGYCREKLTTLEKNLK
jgi:hypothetical protein